MLQLDELNYNAEYDDHVGYHWMCGHFTEKPVDTCLAVQPQSVDVVSMIIGINIGVSVSIVDIVINYSSRSSSLAILRDWCVGLVSVYCMSNQTVCIVFAS